MIYDVVIFNNELDLLETRFNYLNEVVDYFVVTEVDTTFSGSKKPFVFDLNSVRFERYKHKIIYNQVIFDDIKSRKDLPSSGYTDFTVSFPHKHRGTRPIDLRESHISEILQRDSSMDILSKSCNDDDIILMSDVDEIPSITAVNRTIEMCLGSSGRAVYFEQDWRVYWLNYQVQQPWYGSVACSYSFLKTRSIDNLRVGLSDTDAVPGEIINLAGWHLSYLGGHDLIKRKLNDLAYQGLRAELTRVLSNYLPLYLRFRLALGQDILNQGRKFKRTELSSHLIDHVPAVFLEENTL